MASVSMAVFALAFIYYISQGNLPFAAAFAVLFIVMARNSWKINP